MDSLPPELLLHIFSYCNVQDLVNISQVCKHWRALSTHNIMWSQYVFPETPEPQEEIADDFPLRWMWKYFLYGLKRIGKQESIVDKILEKHYFRLQQRSDKSILYRKYCKLQKKVSLVRRASMMFIATFGAALILLFVVYQYVHMVLEVSDDIDLTNSPTFFWFLEIGRLLFVMMVPEKRRAKVLMRLSRYTVVVWAIIMFLLLPNSRFFMKIRKGFKKLFTAMGIMKK